MSAKEARAIVLSHTLPWLIPLIVVVIVAIIVVIVVIVCLRRRKTKESEHGNEMEGQENVGSNWSDSSTASVGFGCMESQGSVCGSPGVLWPVWDGSCSKNRHAVCSTAHRTRKVDCTDEGFCATTTCERDSEDLGVEPVSSNPDEAVVACCDCGRREQCVPECSG
ncbi:hypothetical protein BLNAU_14205 [Blattamonas nauphoetae]|uniref:Uncharacterized protein n=1 Tax=Blattamonas nauphoetae TaxID=2049346 RepID=A0ABQ9XEK4_9EUKA|nr:hypothetical protein BLNAU_14205 [Blattamonas nauphoetae]